MTIINAQEALNKFEMLTPRQREVAVMLANGRRNKEVAASLGMSERTVEVHRANILRTLGVNGAAQLAVLVCRAGMLESAA